MVKEDGQPEPSYQYRSPNLTESHPNIYSSLSHKCCDGPEVVELLADDAGEGGSDHGARQRPLADPGGPQVDVLGGLVHLRVALHRVVRHHPQQVLPAPHHTQSTPLSPPEILFKLQKVTKLDNSKLGSTQQ